MTRLLVHAVAALLLLTQLCVGIAPGRILCIPVGDCGAHELADHCHGHDDDGGHHHGPVAPNDHEHGDCDCHLHVSLPDEAQTPSKPHVRLECMAFHMFLAPVLLAELPGSEPSPHLSREHPPDRHARDQVLSLAATRLLI